MGIIKNLIDASLGQTVSVIIPAYNEERTVASVAEIAASSPMVSEVIVVDDGSTDTTAEAIKRCKKPVKLIQLPVNQGKGAALEKGVINSFGEILVFLDADLVGLTRQDVETMIIPIQKYKADLVVALPRFWKKTGRFTVLDRLSGERVLRRSFFAPYISSLATLGYGVELFLNDLYKNKRVLQISLPYVYIVGKFDKTSKTKAIKSYAKEAAQLLTNATKLHANDLTPQAKRVISNIQSYLKRIIQS